VKELKLQRYDGCVSDYGDCSLDRVGNRIKMVYQLQYPRIYNDEVTRPDEQFIANRVVKYLAPKWDYWCGSAMVAWAKLTPII